ncbi:MAG TPA: LytTR family DNA-binding domain-containing protein [Gemmatimonadaceae bacterium]|nr:LytTR family DNA-binding domain-containing protein [Gemmatimonadaceae bacterium]
MNRLRVITVDDEPLTRERISDLVCGTEDLELVGEASNGLEALDLITSLVPDLVLIDVEMPELSGFGVIAALERDRVPGVVFITAFERYAVQAFEVGAIDYLQKPVTRTRFTAAIERAKERLAHASAAQRRALIEGVSVAERERGRRARFVVRRANVHEFVPVEQVDWMDSADNYIRLHVGTRTQLCRGTMKEMEETLDPARFIRIHRSAIVAADRIATIRAQVSGGYIVQLRTGVRLRSSRHYAARIRSLLR